MNAHEIADRLNELHALDPAAVEEVMCNTAICNERLADHPAAQVGTVHEKDVRYTLRPIGIINALVDDTDGGTPSAWRVAMKIDDADGSLAGFTAVHAPRVSSGVSYAECLHCDGHVFQRPGDAWDHIPTGPQDDPSRHVVPRHPAQPDRSTLSTTHPAETPERAT